MVKVKVLFTVGDSRPFIEVLLNGVPMPALIDTGAVVPMLCLPNNYDMSSLNLTDLNRKSKVTGITGHSIWCPVYEGTIKINSVSFTLVKLLYKETGENPYIILPSSMFTEFTITIDYLTNVLTLENKSNQLCYNLIIVNGEDREVFENSSITFNNKVDEFGYNYEGESDVEDEFLKGAGLINN